MCSITFLSFMLEKTFSSLRMKLGQLVVVAFEAAPFCQRFDVIFLKMVKTNSFDAALTWTWPRFG